VFACIVDLFGISNLITSWRRYRPIGGRVSVWKNRLGDPGTEAAAAFSHRALADQPLERATKPILIAQGMRDVRVVAAGIRTDGDSPQAARRARYYVTFSDEGHVFGAAGKPAAFLVA